MITVYGVSPGRSLWLAVALLTLLSGRWVSAQPPTPAEPSAASSFADVAGGPETFGTAAVAPTAGAAPSYFAGEGDQPTAPRIEMGLVDTITESLFGDVYAEGRWRPLSIGSFLTEGWLEPWAGAPAGRDGRTPRHGWLGAFDGVFYRLWLSWFTYTNSVKQPYGGNSYSGNYQIFLPFSRRFEVSFLIPYAISNGTVAPHRGYTTENGDLVTIPRFLLSESEATTQILAVDVRAPTGSRATGNGQVSLTPRYEFWTNPGGPWVVRGGSGISVPMNTAYSHSFLAATGDLAIGRYFRPHDVPFGDLVLYAASNWVIPLDGTAKDRTYFSIGPGTRFHIADNYFLLHYWEFPLVGPSQFTYSMQIGLLKVF